jgi:CheY-like chemotaxis protein
MLNHVMASSIPETTEKIERTRGHAFQDLMQHRVRRVLLVSTLYESFIMSEEGRLHETLLSQFLALNLSQFPDILRVSDGTEALEFLDRGDAFDLVISSVNTGSADVAEMTATFREAGHQVPVMALAFDSGELRTLLASSDVSQLEGIFLWQGDVRILVAMIKSLEDRLNVENDTGLRGVPAIILVEDNIRFCSSFLPTIYSELFRHTHQLLSEGLSISQKIVRMRGRTKVLLCRNYEDAWDLFERYEEHVLGVISDFEFPMGGKLEKHAGLELCKHVLDARPDVRVVMQSSVGDNRQFATKIGASFLLKGSPVLLTDLRQILVERFGFGDFIFRMPDQSEIDRAHNLKSLWQKMKTVPVESIGYHAARNHFSFWLKTRTLFTLAERLRPRKVDDFESMEHLRTHLLEAIEQTRVDRNRRVIADFNRKKFEPAISITRIGGGSLGGKARGVAFANRILTDSQLDEKYPDVELHVPPLVVLGTHIFDEFLDYEWLRDFALAPNPDEEIERRFLAAPFPRAAVADLRAFLQKVKYPLAVRSSSLLEDSLAQPFAGVYQTYFVPNNDRNLDVRLDQLKRTVKRVYASTFTERAKAYLGVTGFRLEEEKMAVMIQELIGVPHEDRFYPDFAGVARSHNVYPEPEHLASDGVVAVALGMGETVVDGSPCLRFCPRHPRKIIGFSSTEYALENSQRSFYALDLGRETPSRRLTGVVNHTLDVAESDGTLDWLGSTYSPENEVVVDGISRPGVRLVTFAQILKHEAFPLAPLISDLLEECSGGTGAPVEIEFAGNLPLGGRPARFGFLQLRPLALSREREDVEIGDIADEDLLCRSDMVLGNGNTSDLLDIVMVDVHTFDRNRSREVALIVGRFDAILRKEKRPYLLIGVGRWGSADPHLGIPVAWNHICGARVIVECGFRDFTVIPSQGTHFFQNLTSSNVGYLTVSSDGSKGFLDWNWLNGLPTVREEECVKHLRLDKTLTVKLSGETGKGVILK